ncbi:ParE toxin of type II toxin-antitoxin system, parDE [uncultured archaeon]|nr:ParE toxin of type II toxin-antitoxin system, parDE [uncultured archaeon]
MIYKLQLSRKTFDALNKLDRPKKEEIIKVFDKILKDPFSFKPLKYELKGYYRARVGKYRVIFRIDNDIVYIEVIEHRKKVYR